MRRAVDVPAPRRRRRTGLLGGHSRRLARCRPPPGKARRGVRAFRTRPAGPAEVGGSHPKGSAASPLSRVLQWQPHRLRSRRPRRPPSRRPGPLDARATRSPVVAGASHRPRRRDPPRPRSRSPSQPSRPHYLPGPSSPLRGRREHSRSRSRVRDRRDRVHGSRAWPRRRRSAVPVEPSPVRPHRAPSESCMPGCEERSPLARSGHVRGSGADATPQRRAQARRA